MDEHEAHQAFEDLCGGVGPATRLFHLYKNSWSSGLPHERVTKAGAFRKKATRNGWNEDQIEALLALQ